jgi:hypothetical protein
MEIRMRKKILAGIGAGAMLVSMSACSLGKVTEPYQDAKRDEQNSSPADTLTFPDGFSNAATKCDHGNRVYVLFHSDAAYGSIAVVPNDPTCQ